MGPGGELRRRRQRGVVRDFVVANALYWVREYHIDGLRLDATSTGSSMRSPVHILRELNDAVQRLARRLGPPGPRRGGKRSQRPSA